MYQFSRKSQEMQAKLAAFMDAHIYPNEKAYAEQLHSASDRFAPLPLMDELKTKARAAGLWNLFVPEEYAQVLLGEGRGFEIAQLMAPTRYIKWPWVSRLLISTVPTVSPDILGAATCVIWLIR